MTTPASHLVSLAYLASIGLGGGLIGKATASVVINSWNHCVGESNKISKQTQNRVVQVCEVVSGIFFALLAAREVFSENPLLKQIKILKKDLRLLDREVSDLFKAVYNNGIDTIRNFELKM